MIDHEPHPGPSTQHQPSLISVIIEWKNQDLATDDRADAMLTALRNQWLILLDSDPESESMLRKLPVAPCLEILLVYDGPDSRCNLERQLAGRFDRHTDAFALRLIDGAGLTYYQMKLRGAELASGDVLIFLDSDVIPEPSWLCALLDAVLSDGVQIVCGNTYIEPTGLLGKAFALGWFFPLRSTCGDLEVGARCYSNNIAFRREVYHHYPFEPIPGTTRSGMTGLRRTLEAVGIPFHKCHAAQVSHPAPNGLLHVIRRAMAQGRDHYFSGQRNGAVGSARLRIATGVSWRRWRNGLHKTWTQSEAVDVVAAEVPVVMVIICFYYAFAILGTLMTHLAPAYMTRHLHL